MSTSGNPESLPPASWFASGEIDRRKFDEYLLSPTQLEGKHKLRLWESIFGIGVGEGARLEQLIRNQVGKAWFRSEKEKAIRQIVEERGPGAASTGLHFGEHVSAKTLPQIMPDLRRWGIERLIVDPEFTDEEPRVYGLPLD